MFYGFLSGLSQGDVGLQRQCVWNVLFNLEKHLNFN